MRATIPTRSSSLQASLAEHGFVHLLAPQVAALLPERGVADWPAFVASWEGMALDRHMADGGRYRRRRHAILSAQAGRAGLTREADGPHWQALDHNPLNGGVQRFFEPVPPAVTESAAFAGIAEWARGIFDTAEPGHDWHIEAHQFRIEAVSDAAGRPTPEGMHRDGVDWVLVLLVRRENVDRGVTEIAAPDGRVLGTFTLSDPMDAVLLDDRRILHGVTPVVPHDAGRAAWRDVLVLTFRRCDA
jgi:hypothetical protein